MKKLIMLFVSCVYLTQISTAQISEIADMEEETYANPSELFFSEMAYIDRHGFGDCNHKEHQTPNNLLLNAGGAEFDQRWSELPTFLKIAAKNDFNYSAEDFALCTTPDIVIPASDCCNYKYYDQKNKKNVWYRQPKTVFKTEAKAREFAKKVKARMPMYLPYKSSKVRVSSGWHYGNGNFHGAIDYSKKSGEYKAGVDPSFKIYSIADGVVVNVVWTDLSGNMVIIEHTAPNGSKYRSAYMHIRNGFSHDLAKAKAIKVKDPNNKDARDVKYKKFANLSNPSQLLWGTNGQKIKVKVGQKVKAGQHIAYAGNTGYGGAGWGLKQDGKPSNPYSANNHLHLMVTVPDPVNKGHWVQVDPYGVYNRTSSGQGNCYNMGKDVGYARLFAPFYSNFHNVPAEYVNKYFSYYPNMGMALQTISHHRKGNKLLVSGSFQWGLSKSWYARFYMTSASYQKFFNEYNKKGFRPRQISITNDSKGTPRFSVIWQKAVKGEAVACVHDRTDANWNQLWNSYVKQKKYHVAEHVTYMQNGKRRHAAVFVKNKSNGFYLYHNLTASNFNKKFKELAPKWQLTGFHAIKAGSQLRYGGLWRPRKQGYYAFYGLTPSGYQKKFNEMSSKGFRLHKVQGYENSSRFAAIWVK